MSDFSTFITHRNLKFLHMTNFSSHVWQVIQVTNIRYGMVVTTVMNALGTDCTQTLVSPYSKPLCIYPKGSHRYQKFVLFRALSEKGGEFTHHRNFLALFYKVIAPKICVFFCHFFHHYYQNYYYQYHNYYFNYDYHHWYFIPSYAQNIVFDVRGKDDQVARIGGRGAGLANSGNARKKANF